MSRRVLWVLFVVLFVVAASTIACTAAPSGSGSGGGSGGGGSSGGEESGGEGSGGGTVVEVDHVAHLDLAYGPASRHRIDLYVPDAPGPHPTLVWLHGGGFIQGSRSSLPSSLRRTLLAEGWAVASAGYRLAPQPDAFATTNPGPSAPEQIKDVKHAIAHLVGGADTWDLDPSLIVTSGDSAGSYLALMANLTSGHPGLTIPEGDPPIAGSFTYGTPIRLSWVAASFVGFDLAMRSYVGCLWNGSHCSTAAHDAHQFLTADSAPVALTTGTRDWVVDARHATLMATTAAAVGFNDLERFTTTTEHETVGYSINADHLRTWLAALSERLTGEGPPDGPAPMVDPV